jgi:RNA polymerase sigma-70 factor (ECF subfamily)
MEPNLEAAREGNRQAMAHIVDTHYDAVFRFCARRIGADHAADVAQETFLAAQRQIKSFEGRSALRTWLFGIALNHCRNASRRKRLEPLDWTVNEPADNPESTLIDREALRKALRGLSDEHREVVLLHEVDGLTYEEAASVIGIPVGTVKSRLHHAFAALRRALDPCSQATS